MIITLNQLVEKKACGRARDKFFQCFGSELKLPETLKEQEALAQKLALAFFIDEMYWFIGGFFPGHWAKFPSYDESEEYVEESRALKNIYRDSAIEYGFLSDEEQQALEDFQKANCDLDAKYRGKEWMKIIQLLMNNSEPA